MCLCSDSIKSAGFNLVAEMNIADEEEFELMFGVLIVETVAGIVKAFHWRYYSILQSGAFLLKNEPQLVGPVYRDGLISAFEADFQLYAVYLECHCVPRLVVGEQPRGGC